MQKTIKPKMQILPKTLQLSNQDPNLQFLRSENLQIDLELKLDDALYCESVGITGFEVERSKLLVFQAKRETLTKIGYRAFDIGKCFKDTYTDGYPDPSKLFP